MAEVKESKPKKPPVIVFVLNVNGKPLMPCKSQTARHLLKDGKAKVVSKLPFTIKLLQPTTNYTQPISAALIVNSTAVKTAAVRIDSEESTPIPLYVSVTVLRNDISGKLEQRGNYRRTRRSRKTRYREQRSNNRANSCKNGKIPPSIRSKLESIERIKKKINRLLPNVQWKEQLSSFSKKRLENPKSKNWKTANDNNSDWLNIKGAVLARDSYRCQMVKGGKHSHELHVHHKIPRSDGGTNELDNLITACKDHHVAYHKGKLKYNGTRVSTKRTTHMDIIRSQRIKKGCKQTFGYLTKKKRIKWEVEGADHDAILAACGLKNHKPELNYVTYQERHVAHGDYQQTWGRHSEKVYQTGKLFDLRKFDLVRIMYKGNLLTGFVKGKRATGYFDIMGIDNKTILTKEGRKLSGVNVKKYSVRLQARSTTLIQPLA